MVTGLEFIYEISLPLYTDSFEKIRTHVFLFALLLLLCLRSHTPLFPLLQVPPPPQSLTENLFQSVTVTPYQVTLKVMLANKDTQKRTV